MVTAMLYVAPRVDPVVVLVKALLWSLLLVAGMVLAVLAAPVLWGLAVAVAPVVGKLLLGAVVVAVYAVVFRP